MSTSGLWSLRAYVSSLDSVDSLHQLQSGIFNTLNTHTDVFIDCSIVFCVSYNVPGLVWNISKCLHTHTHTHCLFGFRCKANHSKTCEYFCVSFFCLVVITFPMCKRRSKKSTWNRKRQKKIKIENQQLGQSRSSSSVPQISSRVCLSEERNCLHSYALYGSKRGWCVMTCRISCSEVVAI